jgi:hypothetical protein
MEEKYGELVPFGQNLQVLVQMIAFRKQIKILP